MNEQMVLDIGRQALTVAFELAAPALGLGLVVGLAVSIFQAATQIQEITLTFIPKIVAVAVGLVIFGPWMLRVIVGFAGGLFGNLASFAAW